MIALPLAEVAEATRASLRHGARPDALVSSVVIDSRAASPGALFVALRGEQSDGHDHAASAVAAGAVAVLAERDVDVPSLKVEDALSSLGALTSFYLRRLELTDVIALTGSSGKTTTKDLLAHVLERAGPTVAPAGSYNNEIGVPLTVLSADAETRYLVLEMGARGAGHIAHLCRLAPPRVGLVLNVGAAHLGEFGSLEATAAAKQELVECLPDAASGGIAVLNADDPLVMGMAPATSARRVTFGRSARADVRADGVVLDAMARASFDVVSAAGSRRVKLQLHGDHQVGNALAAAAVALELGVDLDQVADALTTAGPRSPWRMHVAERPDGVTVVNDAYNANPASMRAALEALAVLGAEGRRTWAVLGEMLELGAASADEHAAVGRLAAQLNVSRLVVVGAGAEPTYSGARQTQRYAGEELILVADAEAALELLREHVRAEDVVLVKASRRAGLERVATGLLTDPA